MNSRDGGSGESGQLARTSGEPSCLCVFVEGENRKLVRREQRSECRTKRHKIQVSADVGMCNSDLQQGALGKLK
jgi:hypothetical protein